MEKNLVFNQEAKLNNLNNITVTKGHVFTNNTFGENVDLSYSNVETITPQKGEEITTEKIINDNDDVAKEEEIVGGNLETTSKPSWKERRECQLAVVGIVVAILTGVIVPVILHFTKGKEDN